MAKKKTKSKIKLSSTDPFYFNYFAEGGDKDKKENFFKKIGTAIGESEGLGDKIGGVASGVGSLINDFTKQASIADTTGIESSIDTIKNTLIGGSNDDLMSMYNTFSAQDRVKASDLRQGNAVGGALSGVASGAGAGMAFGPIGAAVGAGVGLLSSIGGSIVGNKKARRKARELNQDIQEAEAYRDLSFNNAVSNTDRLMDQNLMANYAAYGGDLNFFATGGPADNLKGFRKQLYETIPPSAYAADQIGQAVNNLTKGALRGTEELIRESYTKLLELEKTDDLIKEYSKLHKSNLPNEELDAWYFKQSPKNRKKIDAYDTQLEITKKYSDGYGIEDEDGWLLYLKGKLIGDTFKKLDKYRPTKEKNKKAQYYTYDLSDTEKEHILNSLNVTDPSDFPRSYQSTNTALANVTLGLDKDELGHYISIYDKYDHDVPGEKLVGKPFEVYERIYYNPEDYKSEVYSKSDLSLLDPNNYHIDKKKFQKSLNSWGYDIAVDGNIGESTLKAFEQFKKDNAPKTKRAEKREKRLKRFEGVENILGALDPLANNFAQGGHITNGTLFQDNLTFFNTGGTHETNPMGGIMIGVDPEGTPNMVEQGEVKWNDYIFSNRLLPSKEDILLLNMNPSWANKSFAKLAKSLNKESDERPNDPISKRGKEDSYSRLQALQEMKKLKENKNTNTQVNTFEEGGPSKNWWDVAASYLPGESESGLLWDPSENPFTGFSSSVLNNKKFGPDFYSNRSSSNSQPNQNDSKLGNLEGDGSDGYATWSRYAPILGSAIGTGMALFDKPDYSEIDKLKNQINNVPQVEYNPLGNYISPNLIDPNLQANSLKLMGNRSNDLLINSAGGNRSQAAASLLASGYNNQNVLGLTLMGIGDANYQRRLLAENFNKDTDAANLRMNIMAQQSNAQSRQYGLRNLMALAEMKLSMKDTHDMSVSANLTNLFNNIGNVGKENFAFNQVNSSNQYYGIRKDGGIYYKPAFYKLNKEDKELIKRDAKELGLI